MICNESISIKKEIKLYSLFFTHLERNDSATIGQEWPYLWNLILYLRKYSIIIKKSFFKISKLCLQIQKAKRSREIMPYVDLSFPLRGTTVPVDHGYALFSAVNRLIPAVHAHSKLAIHPIRGVYAGGGILQLSQSSRLTIRLEADEIKTCLPLSGKTLEIQGALLQLGVPRLYLLTPAVNLRARMVTIKGFLDESAFREAAQRQLDELQVRAELQLGARRTLRIQDKRIVGYQTALLGLTAEESVTIQEHGLGGRRRFGCGVFVRVREK